MVSIYVLGTWVLHGVFDLDEYLSNILLGSHLQ